MLQNATSNPSRGGRRKLPMAFTEHGAIMVANVLMQPPEKAKKYYGFTIGEPAVKYSEKRKKKHFSTKEFKIEI